MIAAIETAIQERLRQAGDAGVLGYRYATLESYPAEWDVYFREKVPNSPGAWAVFAGFGDGEGIGFGGLRAKANFGLVVMAENLRNETAQRHGGPTSAEPGSYQLMLDAVALLQGQTLGLDIGAIEIRSCHIVRTKEIVRERKISMLALELVTTIGLTGSSFGATAPGDFETFHADWELPSRARLDADPDAPGIQLPDDDHADAVDHLTLEILPS